MRLRTITTTATTTICVLCLYQYFFFHGTAQVNNGDLTGLVFYAFTLLPIITPNHFYFFLFFF